MERRANALLGRLRDDPPPTARDALYYLTVGSKNQAREEALAEALVREIEAGAGLVLLAGETIVDGHAFGAPVDPGQLLLLARRGAVSVLSAPGCARSRKENVLDLVLPRLLAGDRLERKDLVALGHGGLLEDVPERGAPRDEIG